MDDEYFADDDKQAASRNLGICAARLQMLPPFSRYLKLTNPPMTGHDVIVAQELLRRSPFVHPDLLNVTGVFDQDTDDALRAFQRGHGEPADGVLGDVTACILLLHESYDKYVDDGTVLPGYLYKVHVPVFANRSIETVATLYDAKMNELHKFRVRTHDNPNFPISQFASNGATMTGLMEFDLNSPEDDPVLYGPYPVNRATKGLQGNAAFLLPQMRYGILMHTGQWANWNPSMPMPNSHGCIHAHPDDIKAVWQILVNQLGVQVRPNTPSVPYPYKPQGLLSVEQIDG